MRISNWSSDVCSSDLLQAAQAGNPVIAIGGTLKTSSKILKLALDHKEVLAFASYAQEGRDAEQLAATVGREQGLRLTADVGRRIAEQIGRASWRERVFQYV